jgi:hypothetical protein
MILIENINEFVGRIPTDHELIVMEKDEIDTAMTLFGFDEIGMFDNMFVNPQYAFLEVV